MTAALVQTIGDYGNGTSTSSVMNVTKTVTLGNSILVSTSYYAAEGTESVTDNLGNTYTMDERYYWSADTTTVSVYRAIVTSAGSLTAITFNHPSSDYNGMAAAEFSGLGTLASSDDTNTGTSTTGTWASSVTIPANGIAIGSLENSNSGTVTEGSASGSPSTSISVAIQYSGSNVGSALMYAIADASEVTAFTGTGTFVSSAWNGVAAIYNPESSGPVWTTPADLAAMGTTPELKFTGPTFTGTQHYWLELDTANTFDTGSLRTYRTDVSQTDWDYWNGSGWTPFPAGGMADTYSGNEVRLSVTSALSVNTWYRRVRAST